MRNCSFAKTKILCTIGPATSAPDKLEKLLLQGIDGIRFNFSHVDYNFFEELYSNIDTITKKLDTPLAVLVDLQGPKIRIGNLEKPEIEIETGEFIEISVNDCVGTKNKICCSYKPLVNDAKVGDPILINDGLIRLRVDEKKENSLICYIEIGGTLKPKKGMNLPGMNLSTPSLTEKDYKDLEFALKHRVDYVALSFVRKASDITELREWLHKHNADLPIIAKIEKKEAVDCIDDIIDVTDGIMIARGDLGVELPPQEVPVLQKLIIKKCNSVGKLVITATQMLESMIENPIPTRAEASDVANAVWDGTDAVMLSGETSIGKYPLKAVKIMNDIVCNTELHLNPISESLFKIPIQPEENLFDSIGRAITAMSRQIDAKAISIFTIKGRTAALFSKFKPKAKIIAFSNNNETINKLCLVWGIQPMYLHDIDKENIAIDKAKELILKEGFVNKGDVVIFTAGTPYPDKSRANWIKFETV